MTGEMHKSEVTREAFPLHFAAADVAKGDVLPFDQYQGPYVYVPGRGRYWLCLDDNADWLAYWYSEHTEDRSGDFPAYADDPTESTAAFVDLLGCEES